MLRLIGDIKSSIGEMFSKLGSRLERNGKAEEVNLLLIGPPACGKTAIIYYLYDFILLHLGGKRNEASLPSDEWNSTFDSNIISEISLSKFFGDIRIDIKNLRDFRGTVPNTINYVAHHTGNLMLRIYNISGEVFNDTEANSEVLREFAHHLDKIDVNSTYTLLCHECQDDGLPGAVDLSSIAAYFSDKELINAYNIFTDISKGIRTIRVATKFDRVCKPARRNTLARSLTFRELQFELVHDPLRALNNNDEENNFMSIHQASYPVPQTEMFKGNKGSYCKNFICTGLYDVKNPRAELYGPDASGKIALKDPYNSMPGFKMMNMFGIVEIFAFIFNNSRHYGKLHVIRPPRRGTNPYHTITDADYRKIIGVK